LLKYVPVIVLTRGRDDLILASRKKLLLHERNQLPTRDNFAEFLDDESRQSSDARGYLYLFPTVKLNETEERVNVTGAGDSTAAGIIAGVMNNYTLGCCIYNGLLSAKLALMTHKNVSDSLKHLTLDQVEKVFRQHESAIQIHSL
jgi:hypothetical protein